MTIAIVDLGISNLASVIRAFACVGAPLAATADSETISNASAVVLPGVGAFGEGMAGLRAQNLDVSIRTAARTGVPILGVCLGMQLLAQSSEEHGMNEGLGLLPGHVRRLPDTDTERVPNIGWCDVTPTRTSVLFPEVDAKCFYHVHSFHFVPEDQTCVAARISFGGVGVVVAVERDNIFGVQFHPEKSQDDGLSLLASFVSHLRQTGRMH